MEQYQNTVYLYLFFLITLGLIRAYLDIGQFDISYLLTNSIGFLLISVALGHFLNLGVKAMGIGDHAESSEKELLDAPQESEALKIARDKIENIVNTFKYSLVAAIALLLLGYLT